MRMCFITNANSTYVICLAEYFAKALGHEVYVISMKKPRREIQGVHVYDLGCKTKIGYLLRMPKIKKLVTVIQPDLLIGYRIQSYGFLAACTRFHPLVLAPESETIVWPLGSRLMRWFCQYAIKRADWITSWGENITQNLFRLGACRKIIDTYPFGVRTDLFFPATEQNSHQTKTIITTRALSPGYHQDVVIKALPQLRQRCSPEIRYLVLGDGAERASLELCAEKSGVKENVQFVGYVPNTKIPEYLRQAAVYISLISTDGVSASLLEAMACGVFPIVPDILANRLWVADGVNGFLLSMAGWRKDKVKGFLAPPDDNKYLVEKIATALMNDALRAKAREINVKMIKEKASWTKNIKRVEESYFRLVAKFPARRRTEEVVC